MCIRDRLCDSYLLVTGLLNTSPARFCDSYLLKPDVLGTNVFGTNVLGTRLLYSNSVLLIAFLLYAKFWRFRQSLEG